MIERRDFLHAVAAVALAGQVTPPSSSGTRIVHRQPLAAPLEGMDAAFVEVTLAPGSASSAHRHSGFVLGYVMEGELSFAIDGQPPRVVKAGEAFYEPKGAVHTTAASALPDRPVKLLAIVVGPAGAPVTTRT